MLSTVATNEIAQKRQNEAEKREKKNSIRTPSTANIQNNSETNTLAHY